MGGDNAQHLFFFVFLFVGGFSRPIPNKPTVGGGKKIYAAPGNPKKKKKKRPGKPRKMGSKKVKLYKQSTGCSNKTKKGGGPHLRQKK